jgi:TetR/AcrR family transcriptional regulator, cholesterol catabolism regulator
VWYRYGAMKTGSRRRTQPRGQPPVNSGRFASRPGPTGRARTTPAIGRSEPERPEMAGPATAAESRRQRHQREILNRLVIAARDLLFSRRLADVRVIDFTEAADVGKGTFFNYFDSKEQLLPPLVVLSLGGQLQDALARARAGEDAWSVMKAAMRAYFCPRVGEWRTYENNLLLAMVVNDEVRRQIAERVRNANDIYDEMIQVGQKQGAFRDDLPAAELRRVLRTFFHGLTIHFWMNDETPTPSEVDDALNVLQRALGPAGQSARSRAEMARRRARIDRRRQRTR